jgi:hypothetical protein
MRKYLQSILALILLLLVSNLANAQADTIMKACEQKLPFPYISDGQQYRALISEGEIAEFKATFYGQATYRIVACSGLTEGELIFTLYDEKRNELFSNKSYQNSSYWDFQFNSTIDCIIEAELSPTGPTSGFALLLIGFKQ